MVFFRAHSKFLHDETILALYLQNNQQHQGSSQQTKNEIIYDINSTTTTSSLFFDSLFSAIPDSTFHIPILFLLLDLQLLMHCNVCIFLHALILIGFVLNSHAGVVFPPKIRLLDAPLNSPVVLSKNQHLQTLSNAVMSIFKQSFGAYIHTISVMIPVNIINNLCKYGNWRAGIEEGFEYSFEYGLKSAFYCGGSELASRLRNTRDEVNQCVGTGCSAAVSCRHGGLMKMIKAFLYGSLFHYGLNHYVPKWINSISNPYDDVFNTLKSIDGVNSNSWLSYCFDCFKRFVLSMRVPIM